MNKLLAKLFGRKAKPAAPKIEPHRLAIVPYNGGITIYGTDTEDNITVGMTEAPESDGEFTTHNCIVSYVEGSIDCDEPNAVALLHNLAEMLGYEVSRKRSQA